MTLNEFLERYDDDTVTARVNKFQKEIVDLTIKVGNIPEKDMIKDGQEALKPLNDYIAHCNLNGLCNIKGIIQLILGAEIYCIVQNFKTSYNINNFDIFDIA